MAEPTTFTGERAVFTVVARLGAGSTAIVYRVRDAEGVEYALKQTMPASGDGTDARAEAELLEALAAAEARRFPDSPSRFPAVVDRDPAGHWFAMEIAAGQSVADLLSERRTLRPEQNVAIALRVAEALQLVEAEGKAATDLKPDAIFWSARSGRVIIIDWNVLADGGADPAEALSHHARLVAGLLDALFAHRRVPAWSPPFGTPPERWAKYPRLVADRLGAWAAEPEGLDLDRVVSGLQDLAAVFGQAPSALLADARACLATVRARRVVAPARRAAGLAEQARVDSAGAARFACRELMQRADDYLGPDGPKLLALWAVVDGADESPPPGEALELIRLRALAGVVRRAPGYADEVGALADAFVQQQWADIPSAARRLAERIDDPAVTQLLDAVGREAAAFAALGRALDVSDEVDGDAERARLKARTALARVAHAERLLVQFEDFAELFDGAPGTVDEAGPPAPEPPPLQRPPRFAAEARPDRLAPVRQRFAERSITRLDDLGPLAESAEGRDFAALVSAWQAVYDASPVDLLDFATRLEQAIEASRARDGCLPLDDFGAHLDGLQRRLGDALVDTQTPDDPGRLAAVADRMSAALGALRGAVGRSSLPDGWRQASLERLDGAVVALDRFAERAREVGSALREWRAEAAAWSLARRLEHLDRLGRRFGELAFVRHAQSALVDEVEHLSIERPADRDRLRELDEARRHLGLGPLRPGRRSMGWALALLALGVAAGGVWWMTGRGPDRADAGPSAIAADAGPPPVDVAPPRPPDAAPDAAKPAPSADRDAAPPPADAAAADTTPRRRPVRPPRPPVTPRPRPPPTARDAAPPVIIRVRADMGPPPPGRRPDMFCPPGYEC